MGLLYVLLQHDHFRFPVQNCLFCPGVHDAAYHCTEEPQFKCSQCGFAAHFKFKLTHHIETVHSDAKHFLCTVCGKGFATKTNLRWHQQGAVSEHFVLNPGPRQCHLLKFCNSLARYLCLEVMAMLQVLLPSAVCRFSFKNKNTKPSMAYSTSISLVFCLHFSAHAQRKTAVSGLQIQHTQLWLHVKSSQKCPPQDSKGVHHLRDLWK